MSLNFWLLEKDLVIYTITDYPYIKRLIERCYEKLPGHIESQDSSSKSLGLLEVVTLWLRSQNSVREEDGSWVLTEPGVHSKALSQYKQNCALCQSILPRK